MWINVGELPKQVYKFRSATNFYLRSPIKFFLRLSLCSRIPSPRKNLLARLMVYCLALPLYVDRTIRTHN